MANSESALSQSLADRFVSVIANILEIICGFLLFFTAGVTVLGVYFRYVLMLLVVLAICVAILSAKHDYKSNAPRASGGERLLKTDVDSRSFPFQE